MSSNVIIPKNEQLVALSNGLPAVYRLIKRYTGQPLRTDFRQFINVTKQELAGYLASNPSLAEKHVQDEREALLLHDHPVLLSENGKWLVCWIDHGSKVDKAYYGSLAEAAANFLMAYW